MRFTRFKQSKRVAFSSKLIVVTMALMMLLSLVLPSGMFTAKAESEGLSEFSLYQRASELSREFGTSLAPGSGDEDSTLDDRLEWIHEGSTGVTLIGNVGGLIGYSDVMSDDEGIIGWLTSSVTTASATITYEQLSNITGGSTVGGDINPYEAYGRYGEALTVMGLAKTIRPNGLDSMGRVIPTFLMMIAYALANVAPFLFQIAINLLAALNPFKLFFNVMMAFDSGVMGAGQKLSDGELGILSVVAGYVSDIFKTIQSFSIYVMMPIFLVVLIFSITVLARSGRIMTKVGRFAVRMFMIVLGLPLIGVTYTGVVEGLKEEMTVGASYADFMVMSSYVDFEGWVKGSRLSLPEAYSDGNVDTALAIPLVTGRGVSDEDTVEQMRVPPRRLILAINAVNSDVAENLKSSFNNSGNLSGIFEQGEETRVEFRDGVTNQSVGSNKGTFREVWGLLNRHRTADTYSGSDFDGEVTGDIQKYLVSKQDKEASVVKMYSLTASKGRKLTTGKYKDEDWAKDVIDWRETRNLFNMGKGGDTISSDPDTQFGIPYTIYNNGFLPVWTDGTTHYFTTGDFGTDGKFKPAIGDNASQGGLSTLAMYNFLNTTFTETGLTVFSPQRSTSDNTRDMYTSVNFGSSGMTAMMRWFENIIIMGAMSIISIGFGAMMISAAIKNLPRILTSVFGTALGSIAMITKLLISVGVMIFQILGMMFFYFLSENIIIGLLIGFDDFTASMNTFFGASGVLADFSRSLMVIITVTLVSWFLLRNGKVFTSMLEETVSNAINRIMSGLDTATGGQGLDLAQTSGGRMGNDGRLTPEAQKSNEGLTGGVMNIMDDAMDAESKRDAVTGNKRGFKEKMGAVAGTSLGLAKAKGVDGLKKGLLGREGRSYDRAKQALSEGIDADKFKNRQESNLDAFGRRVDALGKTATTEGGHALDADGNIVSGMSAPSLDRKGRLMTDADGGILDADGHIMTDEAGRGLYVGSDGKLQDANGTALAMGADGIARPMSSRDSADNARQAMLDYGATTSDSARYVDMLNAQDQMYAGMTNDGRVMSKDGSAIVGTTIGEDGIVRNASTGEAIPASQLESQLQDSTAFQKEIGENGETVLRHKGMDATMMPLPAVMDSKGNVTRKSPQELSKTVAKAQQVADKANARVAELKQSGAPAQEIKRAQHFADKAQANANTVREQAEVLSNERPNYSMLNPVSTPKQLEKQTANVQQARQKAEQAEAVLEQYRQEGQPPSVISQAQQRVQSARAGLANQIDMQQNMELSHQTNRPYQQVAQARASFEQSGLQKMDAEKQLATLQKSGASPQQIAQAQKKVVTTTQAFNASSQAYQAVTQKAVGTPEQITKAMHDVGTAQVAVQTSQSKLSSLQQAGAPQAEVQQAEADLRTAQRNYARSEAKQNELLQPQSYQVPSPIEVPRIDASTARGNLAQVGISTPEDLATRMARTRQVEASHQDRVNTIEQRVNAYRASGRPQAEVYSVEQELAHAQNDLSRVQREKKVIADNAHGLSEKFGFNSSLARNGGNLSTSGAIVQNELSALGQQTRLYDSFMSRGGEAHSRLDKQQIRQIQARMKASRQKLLEYGVDEGHLSSIDKIDASLIQITEEWQELIGE